jgi:hypothetical protein
MPQKRAFLRKRKYQATIPDVQQWISKYKIDLEISIR